MCANWVADNRDVSPDRNNQYQLDNVSLQFGLGLPIQLLGVSLMNDLQIPRHNGFNGRGGHRRNHHRQNQFWQWQGNELEIQQTCDGIPIRKLYVTNIPIEIQKPDLFRIFARFGHIKGIYLGVSKNFNTKQFAFITYDDPLAAARVLNQSHSLQVLGRRLYVNAADSWHQPVELPDGTIDWRLRKNPAKEEETNEQEDQSTEEAPMRIETEINEGSLNMLNDDCLLHIFSFLSLKEITAAERVCKRWQALSLHMWRCLHELNFRRDSALTKAACNTHVLAEYLKRCGSSLTSLYLTNRGHEFSASTLAVVAKHCKNLEVLGVNEVAVAKRSLAHLGRSCPRISQLCLDGCERVTDDELNSLLPKCADLKILELANLHQFTGKCLANIPGPVTNLRLSELSRMDSKLLISGLQKMSPSLVSLTVNACSLSLRSHNVMSKLVEAVPNITSFALTHCMMEYNTQCLTPLGRLKKLTSLNLYMNNAVNDVALAAIVEGCEDLVTLNLCGSSGGCAGMLSERGISTLARLRKLTHLNLSYLEATNNTALKNFTARHCKLKSLECRGCPELADEGAEAVVTSCNDLELFDVSGCQGITDKTAETAVTSVKMRTNNTLLKMIVGGTQINPLLEEVPLLTADFRDLSEEHMRPDFMDDMFFPPSDRDDDEDLDYLSFMFGDQWDDDQWDDIGASDFDDDYEDDDSDVYDFFDDQQIFWQIN